MSTELEQSRNEIERLRKIINDKQQTDGTNPSTSLIDNHEFVVDLTRYVEGILTEQQIKKKYRFNDDTWTKIGEDETLIEAIETEKIRRIRSGMTKRERAQQHIVKAPDILEKIMSDDNANARHRVDSIKALDALADPGPQTAPPADKFIITIDLTADAKLRSAEPDPADVIVIDATPRKTPAEIADKTEDD
jgi:hypothetical protein